MGLGVLPFGPMASLQWIGKEAVVGHHREVPYHLLRGDPALSVGEDGGVGSGNLLVQGDNLLALKALLPYYAGRVKCIYVDPPYNTGNEGWVYNDNTNSPEIRQWIGKVVGKEGETLDRHDRWLCMIYPRLALLKEFLTEDGAIFVSIDENELHVLKLLMDEVFGRATCIGTFCWKTRNTDNRVKTNLSTDHEYVLSYGRTSEPSITGRKIDRSDFKNPDNDPKGVYVTDPLTGKATAEDRPNLHYVIRNPITGDKYPPDAARGWITDRAGFETLLAEGKVWWPPDPRTGKPRKKRYLTETSERMPVSSFWADLKGQTGADELDQILGERMFAFPKAVDFLQRVLDVACPKDSLIMDSFAGSGTTGHAVLAMNKADGGNRRFICIEMDRTIATTITAQRLRKVAEGYHPQGDAKKEKVEGTGGGFRYVTLGEPLFNERGQVRAEVKFANLAAHVFFTETGEPLPKKVNGKRSALIGVCRGTAYYLLFNGILGDKRPDGGNVLTGDVLAELPKHDGPRVVFGEACRLGAARLKREGVVFRQIPYQIKVS